MMNGKKTFFFIIMGLMMAGCAGQNQLTYPYNYTIVTDTVSAHLTPLSPDESTFTMIPTSTEEPLPTETLHDPLSITIVYNNNPHDPRLTADLGFGAYIQYHDQVILFDTGTNGQILLSNMQILGIDPASVQFVVISHAHDDHFGGLADFLKVSSRPPVFLIPSFDDTFFESNRQLTTEVTATTPGQEIAPGIITTGQIPSDTPEQALIIYTSKGLVVITGCAHPGIVRIVERAIELTGEPIYMVMGGFHMWEMDEDQIASIIADLRRLGVQVVAPSHCTGELAIRMFAEEYGDDFIPTGVGSVITIDN